MTAPPVVSPSLRELLLLSDFGRANPARVDELLDRCADPPLEPQHEALCQSGASNE